MTCRRILTAVFVLVITVPPLAYGTNPRTVVLTGQPAPGMPSGSSFNAFGSISLNLTGQIAFVADANGDGGADSIWSEGSGSLARIRSHRWPGAGLPDGVAFHYFDDNNHGAPPVLNAVGRTAFWAYSQGGDPFIDTSGIWTDASGVMSAVVNSFLTPAPSGR